MKSVYSAVRTGSLNKAGCASSVKGLNSLEICMEKEKTNKVMVLRWLALMRRIKQICFSLCRAACITSLNLFLNQWEMNVYRGCPESIQPFWISREPVTWPWCKLTASQRRPYYTSVNIHSPVGLVSRQWDAVDWACVLCDCCIHKSPPFQQPF